MGGKKAIREKWRPEEREKERERKRGKSDLKRERKGL